MEIAKNIPDALAILPQWVCWGAKGKPRKMPFDPRTGTPAKAGQPETWADFQTAAQAVEAGRFGGVGFEFDAAGCVVGIDFDHCLHDGKCDPWVEAWVTKLDRYTEISPAARACTFSVRPICPVRQSNARKLKCTTVADISP